MKPHDEARMKPLMKPLMKRMLRVAAVSTAGTALLVLGVVMLFTPGPGLLAIAAGLAILATEFRWAGSLRDRAMDRVGDLRDRARLERIGTADEPTPARDGPRDRAA